MAKDTWIRCPHWLQAAACARQPRQKVHPFLSLLTYFMCNTLCFPLLFSAGSAAGQPRSTVLSDSTGRHKPPSAGLPAGSHGTSLVSTAIRVNPPVCKSAFQKTACTAQWGVENALRSLGQLLSQRCDLCLFFFGGFDFLLCRVFQALALNLTKVIMWLCKNNSFFSTSPALPTFQWLYRKSCAVWCFAWTYMCLIKEAHPSLQNKSPAPSLSLKLWAGHGTHTEPRPHLSPAPALQGAAPTTWSKPGAQPEPWHCTTIFIVVVCRTPAN